MHRSPKKGKRPTDDKASHKPQLSVHTKNFYIASYPVVLLFNIVRTLLYHAFLLLKTLFRASAYISHSRKETAPIVITEIVSSGNIGGDSGLKDTETKSKPQEEQSAEMPPKFTNPGPGDPLLAKQKHHHRKAFEYISKALKIDEENEG